MTLNTRWEILTSDRALWWMGVSTISGWWTTTTSSAPPPRLNKNALNNKQENHNDKDTQTSHFLFRSISKCIKEICFFASKVQKTRKSFLLALVVWLTISYFWLVVDKSAIWLMCLVNCYSHRKMFRNVVFKDKKFLFTKNCLKKLNDIIICELQTQLQINQLRCLVIK